MTSHFSYYVTAWLHVVIWRLDKQSR